MGKRNLRRMEVSSAAPGIGNSFIDMQFLDDSMVNLHGYIAQFSLEPQDAGANTNGIWAVWVLPNDTIQNSDLPVTFGDFGSEDRSAYMWGYGPVMASNETPQHVIFQPKGTRNMQRNSRVVLQILLQGVSAGLVRVNTTQSGFVTQVT